MTLFATCEKPSDVHAGPHKGEGSLEPISDHEEGYVPRFLSQTLGGQGVRTVELLAYVAGVARPEDPQPTAELNITPGFGAVSPPRQSDSGP